MARKAQAFLIGYNGLQIWLVAFIYTTASIPHTAAINYICGYA